MNVQKISPDDPRLTAYALGELSAAECAEIEAAMATDPAARAVVEDVRALAAQLEGALAKEQDGVVSFPLFADSAKTSEPNTVGASAKEPSRAKDPYAKKVTRFPYVLIGSLAAACFAVMFVWRADDRVSYAKKQGDAPQSQLAKTSETAAEKTSVVAASAGAVPTGTPAPAEPSAEGAARTRVLAEKPMPSVLLVKDADEFASIPAPEVKAEKVAGELPKTEGAPADTLTSDSRRAVSESSDGSSAPPRQSEVVALAAAPSHAAPEGIQIGGSKLADAGSAPITARLPADGSEEIIQLSAFTVRSDRSSSAAMGTSTKRGQKAAAINRGNGAATRNSDDENVGTGRSPGEAPYAVYSGPRMNFRAKTTMPMFNTESYAFVPENDFFRVRSSPLSTFSVDVDTASYANVRRFLAEGQRPPRDAVRIEEMVNYFNYRYAPPAKEAGEPFAASMEIAAAPWNPAHRLVRIGLKGREVATSERPAANLVFLLDVSGSMSDANKLPLVKESLRLLVEKLRGDDRVAIVTYAGASGLALPSTPASKKSVIIAALDELQPAGSTNGAMGIQLAYDIAKANFIAGGANRVILCTDGDFNVGVTGDGDLTRLIEEKARSGVFLTVLGFGMGNLKDGTLERLADKGNGNYGYIDSRAEAHKLLVEQAGSTLVTIAKDVKLQVEFNPAVAQAYRLIGYENRALKKEDFNNDKVDAGEIGAGHTVTALYEIVPVGAPAPESLAPSEDPLKYQGTAPVGDRLAESGKAPAAADGEVRPLKRRVNPEELLTLKIRFKEPTVEISRKMEIPVVDVGLGFDEASKDFKFAAAVASLGMMLRESAHLGTTDYDRVISWAEAGKGEDADGRRGEFIELAKKARALTAE